MKILNIKSLNKMKDRKSVLLVGLVVSLFMFSCKNEEVTPEDTDEIIVFTDTNFKAVLINDTTINTNNDSEITHSEALNFTGIIAAQNSNISNVEGIEFFVNATRIALFNNNLSTIDVSKNTKVTQLLLSLNNLTGIDVSNLTVLTDFKCHSNNLTEANIANGNNANMTRMELQGNASLTCITVDQLPVPTTGWGKDNSASYSTECD